MSLIWTDHRVLFALNDKGPFFVYKLHLRILSVCFKNIGFLILSNQQILLSNNKEYFMEVL